MQYTIELNLVNTEHYYIFNILETLYVIELVKFCIILNKLEDSIIPLEKFHVPNDIFPTLIMLDNKIYYCFDNIFYCICLIKLELKFHLIIKNS